jgi:hypothetical protein
VSECDRKTSIMRRPWHTTGCYCMEKETAWLAVDLMRWNQNCCHRIYDFKAMYGNYMTIIFSGSAAQRALWPPRHTRFLDHTQRRAAVGRTPFGRVISSSQRPLPDNKQDMQETSIHAPGRIQTRDCSRRPTP